MEFGPLVQPVNLPKKLESFDGEMATCTGWGTTEEGGSMSNHLQKVDMPILLDDDCRQLTGYDDSEIYDSMVCIGNVETSGQDACQGDSGGPCILADDSRERLLVAIVSWGYGCARPNYPGVDTEVSYFVDWIAYNTA